MRRGFPGARAQEGMIRRGAESACVTSDSSQAQGREGDSDGTAGLLPGALSKGSAVSGGQTSHCGLQVLPKLGLCQGDLSGDGGGVGWRVWRAASRTKKQKDSLAPWRCKPPCPALPPPCGHARSVLLKEPTGRRNVGHLSAGWRCPRQGGSSATRSLSKRPKPRGAPSAPVTAVCVSLASLRGLRGGTPWFLSALSEVIPWERDPDV